MRIDKIVPSKTAVLVIDMQNDFIEPGAPIYIDMGYKMVPALKEFLDRCRAEKIQIIYTRDVVRADGKDMAKSGEFCTAIKEGRALVDGMPGAEIYEEVAPGKNDIVIDKNRYSAFCGTTLDSVLRTLGIDTVAIVGVCTECCCFSTARDAGGNCYDVAFLSDLTGNNGYEDNGNGEIDAESLHRAMLIMIGHTTAHVMDSKEFLGKIEKEGT
ncbi:MAG: cysteine hydrolase [Lachnospiraceae bacterium]|mgnify:CR=1 FL=1|nr:cysteine hydrolase [Lachnospiraceae bacterium]